MCPFHAEAAVSSTCLQHHLLSSDPPHCPAPFPSAVDPHSVKRAWSMVGVQVERATVRTTWTPWAASARLRLGRRWTGWEPPRTPQRTRTRERRPLHPGAGRSPAGGTVLTGAAHCGARLMATGPIHQWARVGAACAERAGDRSAARSGAGKRALRSRAQPELE